MLLHTKTPRSWLAFDLNVLRRLKFRSASLPFADSPAVGSYLKRWDVRVSVNDPLQSAWTQNLAEIANGRERLSADDLEVVLDDAYVPGYKLANPSLTNWFSETDSWWFDNIRRNIDRIASPFARAAALGLGLAAGDYVLSFNEGTRQFRQPLSTVYRRLWSIQPPPYDNGQQNAVENKRPDDFIAEAASDLMFLRLPAAYAHGIKTSLGGNAWREEWIRGGNEFWADLEASLRGRLGAATETKSQYLDLLEKSLKKASHMRAWAVAHVEDGFLTAHDIVETIGKIRRVDAVFTKDFSELTGTKAVIVTA